MNAGDRSIEAPQLDPGSGVRLALCGDALPEDQLRAALAATPYDWLPDPSALRDGDVLLLSRVAPARELLKAATDARSTHVGPLVALIGEPPTAQIARGLIAQLDGVVMWNALALALAPTLDAVLAGQAVHPMLLRERLAQPLLSTREKQVLAMVVLGLPNAEIAGRMFLSEASIKAHLTSAFAKLGVRSREAASALILDPDAGYGPGILRITPADD